MWKEKRDGGREEGGKEGRKKEGRKEGRKEKKKGGREERRMKGKRKTLKGNSSMNIIKKLSPLENNYNLEEGGKNTGF